MNEDQTTKQKYEGWMGQEEWEDWESHLKKTDVRSLKNKICALILGWNVRVRVFWNNRKVWLHVYVYSMCNVCIK